ncbi:hypothetical protein LINPERHAP1_LOCUS23151 [Linum perenne]
MVAWVRFPHLPIHFYHGQVLTSLGNLIGKTVKIDFNTQTAERGKFARIAIEIDLDKHLSPVVLLDGTIQQIEYENLPREAAGSNEPSAANSFGPWMMASRRSRHPAKESVEKKGMKPSPGGEGANQGK